MSKYREDIDVVKGIAIIAVVLFHLGLLNSGYLGVDAFFVINGFLIIPSLLTKIQSSEFAFFSFVERRIIRLLPLIVIASAVSLFLGAFLMLPDDYENLSQSVIASNVMSENILDSITTKRYWNPANEYKPLMHLWYIGVLFEFYILMPLLLLLTRWCAKILNKDSWSWMVAVLGLTTIISLSLYLFADVSDGNRFYYLPYRFFEIGIGGCVALILSRRNNSNPHIQMWLLLLLTIVVACSLFTAITGNGTDIKEVVGEENVARDVMPLSGMAALLLTVVFTCAVLYSNKTGNILWRFRCISFIGKMSYSLFICHQVLLAFYRYSISYTMNVMEYILFLLAVFLLSYLCYCLIEKHSSISHRKLVVWLIAAVFVVLPSSYVYLHAGVVRDVPELGIVKGFEHRGMNAEYCDRIYDYKQFPQKANGKWNVLVEGLSFGRDFANVLLESKYKDSINIAYIFNWDDPDVIEKVRQSDYIFVFSSKDEVPKNVFCNMRPSCRIKCIGTKNFGGCMGTVYVHRGASDYYTKTNMLMPGYTALNEKWKKQWKTDYIDMLAPVVLSDNHVRVFTDNCQFISQDCRHLTKAGAQWYAKVLDWDMVFR